MIFTCAFIASSSLFSPDSIGMTPTVASPVMSITRIPVRSAGNFRPVTDVGTRQLRDRASTRSVLEERPTVIAAVPIDAADPWLGPDKVKHFFTAAFVQGSGYGALRATNLGHGSSVLGASLGTTAAGLLKEMRDRRAGGRFSVRDLAWNTAGAAAATILLERTRR